MERKLTTKTATRESFLDLAVGAHSYRAGLAAGHMPLISARNNAENANEAENAEN